MPVGSRPRREPTDDWAQLRLLVSSPEQETYELLRPIVLFGQPAAARARETGVPERTLRRRVVRFAAMGMRSLFDEPSSAEDRRRLPAELRHAIVTLKAEYPPFILRAIARICQHRFDRPVDHHTVRRVLSREPLPINPPRRFPPYHAMADPVQRRLAVVRLAREGWGTKAIAGYLGIARSLVYETLERWQHEGWPGSRTGQPGRVSRPARSI